jgi:acylphosphatase
MKKVKITVSGLVQGVGFRYFCYKKALDFGVKGYVKNLHNEKVELEVEGDDGIVNDYIKEIEIGPVYAEVNAINVLELEYKGEYNSFSIF